MWPLESSGYPSFNFIELKKFNKGEEELSSLVEKWIYFIKNAENLSVIPKSAIDIPELHAAYTQAAMNAWTEEELEIYEYWQIRDAGDRYAIREEFEKGLEQGIERRNVEVAIEMIKDGESNSRIKRYTGLSEDDIEQLKRGA